MKEEFEKWWATEHGNLQHSGFIGETIKMVAMQSWRASRAAIEIELPEASGDDYGHEIFLLLPEVESAITSHGIRIKGKTS